MSKRFLEPEWLKVQDASTISGLSVSEIFRACMTEQLENVHIVKPGKRKGVRLVSKQSLNDYIRSFLPGGSRYQKSRKLEASR
jgi:hypothetical protein